MAKQEQAKAAGGEIKVDEAGQLSVPLGDPATDYLLRPSYRAIVEIERQTQPLFELARSAMNGSLRLEDMAIIVTETMKAQGAVMPPDDPSRPDYVGAKPERVGALIMETGIPAICGRLIVLLSGALSGGYTAEGEAKPAKQSQTA